MTLQELTNRLQDLCHSGHAQDYIGVSILDATYAIDDIKTIYLPNVDDEYRYIFMIKAATNFWRSL